MSIVSTESRFSRRRVGGFFLGAAAFALLTLSPSGVSADGGGSIAISAEICATPEDAVTLYNCYTADTPGEMIITSEDGSIYLTSADDTVHGGNSVWGEGDNLPFGLYFIDHAGLVIPDGYQLWTYTARFGDIGGSEFGLYANLSPDQPNAHLAFVLAPVQTDSDGDGASDDVETEKGSDPFDPASFPSQQAGCPPDDSDGDGLTDCEEIDFLGTDPYSVDTDGDGDVDPSEIAYGSDPLDPADFPPGNAGYPPADSDADSDGDTLTDAEEVEVYGTDPNSADTDGDGASDYAEVWAGIDPLDPAASPSGQAANAPAASPSPAPSASGKAAVTQLPNTGVGLDDAGSASPTGLLGVLSAAALALGGFVANRRRA